MLLCLLQAVLAQIEQFARVHAQSAGTEKRLKRPFLHGPVAGGAGQNRVFEPVRVLGDRPPGLVRGMDETLHDGRGKMPGQAAFYRREQIGQALGRFDEDSSPERWNMLEQRPAAHEVGRHGAQPRDHRFHPDVERGEIAHEQHEQRIADHHGEIATEPPPSHVLEHEQLDAGHVQGQLAVEPLVKTQFTLRQALKRIAHLPQPGDLSVDRFGSGFGEKTVVLVLAERRGGDRIPSQQFGVIMLGDLSEARVTIDRFSMHAQSLRSFFKSISHAKEYSGHVSGRKELLRVPIRR
ncbi:MAG: hypothetical protein BWY66_00739 [bacterium ADurb.Bin374]|nr:MAG: hypothetical protein BWY66_00739 [bacterium ADurb.Bin374]